MTPTGKDDLGRRLRRFLFVALAATLTFSVATGFAVAAIVGSSQAKKDTRENRARIDAEGRLRCRGDVQARAENRHGYQTVRDRVMSLEFAAFLDDVLDALPALECVKIDGKWTAQEVKE